jgi:hypothetical protein
MQAMCQLHGRHDSVESGDVLQEEALADTRAGEQFLESPSQIDLRARRRGFRASRSASAEQP